MPSGKDITLQERLDIKWHLVDGRSPDQIFSLMFGNDTNRISIKWLKTICTLLQKPNDNHAKMQYLRGPSKFTRTDRKIT